MLDVLGGLSLSAEPARQRTIVLRRTGALTRSRPAGSGGRRTTDLGGQTRGVTGGAGHEYGAVRQRKLWRAGKRKVPLALA
jgi:hypothetical protein